MTLDVNECELELDDCDQTCINVMGSFECGCNEGYALASEGSTTCVDVDECALDLHNCQQGCENTMGGFWCTCFNGYELNPDQMTCTGNITMIRNALLVAFIFFQNVYSRCWLYIFTIE